MNKRIVSLDWLRGLMALSILFYHISDFTFTANKPLDSSDILGRLGIYAVSIFFILSGLSMALVYHSKINSFKESGSFFVKRLFRILPLLWVVCFLKLAFLFYQDPDFTIKFSTIVLNITGIFGFIKPGGYIPLGAWSIGNELVYYTLTPFIIFLFNKRKLYGNLFFILTLIISFYFSTYLLSDTKTLQDQWLIYINPFNNFSLYVAGFTIFYNLREIKINKLFSLFLLLFSILSFSFFSEKGDLITIVTGISRLFFIIVSFLIVIGFYTFDYRLPRILDYPLEKLGIATYGVYLLHPIVFMYLSPLFTSNESLSFWIILILTLIITVVLALISFYYFESKMMKLSKKIHFFENKNE